MPTGKHMIGKKGAVGFSVAPKTWCWISRVKNRTDGKPLIRVVMSYSDSQGWNFADAMFWEPDDFKENVVKKLAGLVDMYG